MAFKKLSHQVSCSMIMQVRRKIANFNPPAGFFWIVHKQRLLRRALITYERRGADQLVFRRRGGTKNRKWRYSLTFLPHHIKQPSLVSANFIPCAGMVDIVDK